MKRRLANGEPFMIAGTSGTGRVRLLMAICVTLAALAGCSGSDEDAEARRQALDAKRDEIIQKARDTAAGVKPEPAEEAADQPAAAQEEAPAETQSPLPAIEQRRKDVRVIDGIAGPRLKGDKVVRLPGIVHENPSLPDPNSKPKDFPLPVVEAANLIVSDDTEITLAGIKPLPVDRKCEGKDGQWPCGNFAKAQLQRFIRSRTITCEPKEGSKNGKWLATCSAGQSDLGEWLVENGWAEAAAPDLKELEKQARDANRGIWGSR
jgi:endonuclease YncB( thermonuclease family)